MKTSITLLLLFGLLLSCNTKPAQPKPQTNTKEVNIENLVQSGFEAYKESPKTAIPIFQQVAIAAEKQGDLPQAGITNLNIANIYDEHIGELDTALIFAKKSLGNWITQNDSLQMANLYKYIGLLHGRLGHFDVAEEDILKAIKMYKRLDFNQGIAVSEFNLSDLYYQKKAFEKSTFYFEKAKTFWKKQNDNGRIYAMNILGIKILQATNKPQEAERLIDENREIEQISNIDESTKNSFEELLNSTR